MHILCYTYARRKVRQRSAVVPALKNEVPKKIAVIGLGNTLRRDDGIGIVILESLLKSNSQKIYGSKANVNLSSRLIERQKASVNLTLSDPERAERVEGESKGHNKDSIDYFNFGTASFDLIHRMRDYDTVLLIDAINASLPSGEASFFELKDVKYNIKESPISTHELNLTGLFELSKAVNLKTKIYVAGIQIEDTSWIEGLSDSLKKRKDDIVKQISVFIEKAF